jgi:hypothetical protein
MKMGKKKDIMSIDISKKIIKEKQKLPSSLHALKNRQITQDQDTYREDHICQIYSHLHDSGDLSYDKEGQRDFPNFCRKAPRVDIEKVLTT